MALSSVKEIWADEIVTPKAKGGLEKYRPGRIVFSKSGEIIEVSSISRSKLSFKSKKVDRARVLTPGLVDAHSHLVFAGNRADEWNARLKGATYQDIAAKGGGIQNTVRATRAASLKDLIALAVKRCDYFLSFGVTSLEVKSGYGLDLMTELRILEAVSALKNQTPIQLFPTFMGAHTKPSEFETHSDFVNYLIAEVLPEVRGQALFQDVFCERGYFSEKDSIRLLMAGKKWGLRPKVHAHEFGRTGGVNAAAAVGAVSADHLMDVSDSDIFKLKQAKVIPVVLPGTSFFLGAKKFSPARKMWDRGLKVAIASDYNPGTNPTQNMPLIGTFAAVYQGLSLEEILTAQTWHGALALGLRDRGCLERGKRADFVTWDHSSFEEIYYSYGNSRVASAYLGGKKVL